MMRPTNKMLKGGWTAPSAPLQPEGATVLRMGRPRRKAPTGRYPNRIGEIRTLRGMTQEQLAERTPGISRKKIGDLETGKSKLKADDAVALARGLKCAAADLFAGARGVSVPVELAVASAFSERAPADFDLAEPLDTVPPLAGLAQPDNCFAARLLDNSADRLYPAGTVLIVRRREALDAPLKVGTKVLARRFKRDRADGDTLEILAGILDITMSGEVLLSVRSNDRQLPPAVPVKTRKAEGLRDAQIHYGTMPAEIDYRPEPDDQAEILGRIVMAITPE